MRVIAVVPAAGSGVRFGAAVPKQYLEIEGRSLLLWTLERFVTAGVERIVLPVSALESSRVRGLVAALEIPVDLVEGGATRQASVLAGLRAITKGTDGLYVAVHDAVRPCFSRDLWGRLLEATHAHGAAVPVLPPSDTVHQVRDGFVSGTLERDRLGLAQTPQVFRFEVLSAVMEAAATTGLTGTDEAGLVASAGHPVAAVEGEIGNMKITQRDDLVRVVADIERWRQW